MKVLYYNLAWRIFYLSFISVFSVSIFLYSFHPEFGKPHKRNLRAGLFLSLGVSAGIPIFHLLLFSDYLEGTIPNPTFINWILGGLSYVFGCFIYASRFPEKHWPGKFCIIVKYLNIGK